MLRQLEPSHLQMGAYPLMEGTHHPESRDHSLTEEEPIGESEAQVKSGDSQLSDTQVNEPDWSKEQGSDSMMDDETLERIKAET